MRNSIIVLILLISCQVLLEADPGYPIRYDLVDARKGAARRLLDAGSRTYLNILPRPAWEIDQDVLQVERDGKAIRKTSLDGRLVRAVHVDGGSIYCVAVDGGDAEFIQLDTTLSVVRRGRMEQTSGYSMSAAVNILGRCGTNTFAVLSGSDLQLVRVEEHGVVAWTFEQNVLAATVSNTIPLSYVKRAGTGAYLFVTDTMMRTRIAAAVPFARNTRIDTAGNHLVIYTSVGDGSMTQISVVDPLTSTTIFMPVSAASDLVSVFYKANYLKIAMVRVIDDRYEYIITDRAGLARLTGEPAGERLTLRYFVPQTMLRDGDSIYVFFQGGIVVATTDGSIVAVDPIPTDVVGDNAVITPSGDLLVINGSSGSVVLQANSQPFWLFVRAYRNTARFAVPILLMVALIVLIVLYRRQRRLLRAALDLPGSGLVFYIDENGRLLRANAKGMELLGITARIPMRRLFRYYAGHSAVREILEFVSDAQTAYEGISRKVTVGSGDTVRDYLFSSVLLRSSLGRNAGAVITGMDITEALEQRRLVNWAQLAHDMQTNLSTIRLNAENLDDTDSGNAERKRRILYQVGVLIQRVRDLVTVGRSRSLDLVPIHSAELCTEIRHEFDQSVFPNVTFSMKLRGTLMHIDKQKVSRAIRNAVENGIRAMKGRPGTIELATWFDRSNIYIKVGDNGCGMDEETLNMMMKPYFTTSRDGTGTGIGTMIMQHVMQAHGGSLRVTSEPGRGTQIIFRFPSMPHTGQVAWH